MKSRPMKRKKEKTTILFVNKHAQGIKPVQVSSSLILHWRKYLTLISLVFLALIGTIVYLTSDNLQHNKIQSLLSKKIRSMHMAIAKVDTNAIRQKFTKIDDDLSTITKFLKARGIQTSFKGPQGGEADDDILSAEEIGDFYGNYLDKVIYNISYTPLGLPFHGAITSSFGHRENPFGGANIETHKGLDIKGPYGAAVKSMAKGKVVFAGPRGGFGNCIILRHGNGFETLYGHLSKINVSLGDKIEIGQQIGNIGSTGRSTGPHLHYEVHRNGDKINPQSFLTLN